MNQTEYLQDYLATIKSLLSQMDKLPEIVRQPDNKEEFIASKVATNRLTERVSYYSEFIHNEELDCVQSELQNKARRMFKNPDIVVYLQNIRFEEDYLGIRFYVDLECETDEEWSQRIAEDTLQAEKEWERENLFKNHLIDEIMRHEKVLATTLRNNLARQ